MKVTTGKVAKPQKVVLYGPEGVGKTTLASKFPDPLFIDTEGSTTHIDVRRVDPAPTSWSMLLGYVNEVAANPSICQTLVLDTADWAERLCVEHVLAKNNWATIETPGYGRGYREVNEEFGRLLDKLSDVIERGVNVVVTAHARIAKFEQPDEMGAYDRWSLKLFDSPKSSNAAMLKEWADMLLFLNYKTNIIQPDSKTGGKAKAMGGKRVMYTTHTPAWDAKNRCGLADELPMEYAAIGACIPSIERIHAEIPIGPNDAPRGEVVDVFSSARKADEQLEAMIDELKGESAPAIEETPPPSDDPPNRAKLRDLMRQSGIEDAALMAYCGERGYCPADTPIDVYPEEFCGAIVTHWQEFNDALSVPIM